MRKIFKLITISCIITLLLTGCFNPKEKNNFNNEEYTNNINENNIEEKTEAIEEEPEEEPEEIINLFDNVITKNEDGNQLIIPIGGVDEQNEWFDISFSSNISYTTFVLTNSTDKTKTAVFNCKDYNTLNILSYSIMDNRTIIAFNPETDEIKEINIPSIFELQKNEKFKILSNNNFENSNIKDIKKIANEIGIYIDISDWNQISFYASGKEDITFFTYAELLNIEKEEISSNESLLMPFDEIYSDLDNENVSIDKWKETTKDFPGLIGEYIKIKRFNPFLNVEFGNTEEECNEYIGVCINKVIKGKEAQKIAKNYLSSNKSFYTYEQLNDETEYIILNITFDFSEYTIPEYGCYPSFETIKIFSEGKNVLYNKEETKSLENTISINMNEKLIFPGKKKVTCQYILNSYKEASNPIIEIGDLETKGYIKIN